MTTSELYAEKCPYRILWVYVKFLRNDEE